VVSVLLMLLSPLSLAPDSPMTTGMGGMRAPCSKQQPTAHVVLVASGQSGVHRVFIDLVCWRPACCGGVFYARDCMHPVWATVLNAAS